MCSKSMDNGNSATFDSGMIPGCKCGSMDGLNGKSDNPRAAQKHDGQKVCCDKGTRTLVYGTQKTSYSWCEQTARRFLLAAALESESAYEFDFMIQGNIVVGQFGASVLATFTNGMFTIEVEVSTTFTVAGVTFKIDVNGNLKLPCSDFGDIDMSGSITVTDVSENLMGSLGGIIGSAMEGSLVGDCSSTWTLSLTMTFPQDSSLDIGPISLPMPSTVSFGYKVNTIGSEVFLNFEYDMFSVFTSLGSGYQSATLQTADGFTLRKVIEGVIGIVNSDDSAGEVDESPLDGAGKASGIFDEILDATAPRMTVTIAKASRTTSIHVSFTLSLVSIGFEFEISALFVKKTKWSVVFYAGITVPDSFTAIFPPQLQPLGVVLDSIMLVAGKPNKFAFIYSKDKLKLNEGLDFPDGLLPYKTSSLKKGISMYMETDLVESPPGPITTVVVKILEALSGGRDNADDLPEMCEKEINKNHDNCKRSPMQEVFKECSDKNASKEFDMAVPIDGPSICFTKQCGSKPEGYPMGDGGFKFMTVGLDFCATLIPPAVEAAVEVSAEFYLPNGEDKYGTPLFITAEASVKMSISVSITAFELEVKAQMQLKGENQLWVRPFGMPNMGIIFPFSFGIGLKIVYATPVPVPTYFELQFGFMVGARRRIIVKAF
jgi:hypothetical protein